jgi:sulfite reductase alpha subunit-like flavoprotein
LRRGLPSDSLKNLLFGVFGLGDSSYTKFNFVSKKLFKRLKDLGATPLLRRGDGDDQHRYGLYGDLYPWMDELFAKLLEKFPLPPGVELMSLSDFPQPKYRIVLKHQNELSDTEYTALKRQQLPEVNSAETYQSHQPFYAILKSNERITASDWEQDVRHVVFDITGSKIRYKPGDIVYVKPQNFPEETEDFIKFMNFDPEAVITQINPTSDDVPPPPFTLPITVRDLFINYLDIFGTPRRYFFEMLSHFVQDELQRNRLRFFVSREGQEELYDYNQKSKRSCVDVFRDFDSAKPSLEYLIDMIPKLQPRPFSISSSQKAHPNEIHVTVVVVKYKSPIHRLKRGICSTWLATMQPNTPKSIVPLWVKSGTLHFPENLSTPVVLVGPGTGCAIFRAFLYDRRAKRLELQRNNNASVSSVGQVMFFFGCRKQTKDFLYESEWKSFLDDGTLTHFIVAFSRDQPQKVYVQHWMKQYSKEIWNILHNEGGRFYLSGNATKMPRDVRKTLQEIIQKEGGYSEEESERYLRTLELHNRYMTETWA